MRAIYINLDPYLAAFAAWLKGGKSGPAPSFDPLPVAVTIPLGESACIFLPAQSAENPNGKINPEEPDSDWDAEDVTIDDVSVGLGSDPVSAADLIDSALVPGLSTVAPGIKYAAARFSGGQVKIYIGNYPDDITVTFTVLVRRETASGPVDLVDFTPPAAPSAADIKSALVAAGDEALAGVNLNGAWFDDGSLKVLKAEQTDLSKVMVTAYDDASGSDILSVSTPGS